MNSVFKGINVVLPLNIQMTWIHYNNLSEMIKVSYINYLNQNDDSLIEFDLENIFYQHSLSYEIFIKDNKEDVTIPRY